MYYDAAIFYVSHIVHTKYLRMLLVGGVSEDEV